VKILKEFFFELREWFADVADHIKLFVAEMKIENLNDRFQLENRLGFDINSRDFIIFGLWIEIRHELLLRIKAREIRHQRVVAR